MGGEEPTGSRRSPDETDGEPGKGKERSNEDDKQAMAPHHSPQFRHSFRPFGRMRGFVLLRHSHKQRAHDVTRSGNHQQDRQGGDGRDGRVEHGGRRGRRGVQQEGQVVQEEAEEEEKQRDAARDMAHCKDMERDQDGGRRRRRGRRRRGRGREEAKGKEEAQEGPREAHPQQTDLGHSSQSCLPMIRRRGLLKKRRMR